MSPYALSAVRGDHAERLSLAMVISLSLNSKMVVLHFLTQKEIKLDPLDQEEHEQASLTIPMVLLLLLIHMF